MNWRQPCHKYVIHVYMYIYMYILDAGNLLDFFLGGLECIVQFIWIHQHVL